MKTILAGRFQADVSFLGVLLSVSVFLDFRVTFAFDGDHFVIQVADHLFGLLQFIQLFVKLNLFAEEPPEEYRKNQL